MKIGTIVKNEYQGILRFGKVNAIFKGNDGWTWCEVDWVDDEVYEYAISFRNTLSGKDHSKPFYRVDELDQFDLSKVLKTLNKLK